MFQMTKTPLIGTAVLLLGFTTRLHTPPPGDASTLQTFVKTQLQLTDDELTELTQGKPVVKTLDATASREIITVGGIYIQSADMPKFVEQFKTLEGFKTSQFILQIQKFGARPDVRDLETLSLEAADVESFRSCRVGDCGVQLSADDINRFSSQVNWKAPSAVAEATAVYKSILFSHLNAYRASGLAQLPLYHDREPPMSLSAETSSLLDATPALFDRAAGFQHRLRVYPSVAAPNAQDFFYWSKESFGFKPVVGLNHVSVQTEPDGDVVISTTQIYASHYMDGSVAINALIPDPRSGRAGFYWLYTNRSRVGRLSGLLGAFARPIVQRRARAGLIKSLVQTKQRFEAAK